MRVPVIGGPHDGSEAIVATHQARESVLMLDDTPYVFEWPKDAPPRLVFKKNGVIE